MNNSKITKKSRRAVAAILAVLAIGFAGSRPLQADPPTGVLSLAADFTFSGTFSPTPIDTDKDGLVAEAHNVQVIGMVRGSRFSTTKLTTSTAMHEYGLLSPGDTCTSCFRVNEDDFSVQENAYIGPLANLIRPIRDPVHNPTSAAYGAEEWTNFYTLETGELIFAQTTALQICVENIHPIPVCHLRGSETIVGGTGRFKNATGSISFTGIAPTYPSDGPLLDENGCIDPTRPMPSFSFGPIYGAGHMNLQVPAIHWSAREPLRSLWRRAGEAPGIRWTVATLHCSTTEKPSSRTLTTEVASLRRSLRYENL